MHKAWRLAVVMAAGAATTLSGCERQDDRLAAEITQASHALSLASGSGRVLVSEESRSKTYAAVISDLTAALDGASDENKAVAQLLMARAKTGQGAIEGAALVEHLAALTHQVTLVRAAISRMQTQLRVAESLAGFDPSQTLAMVDKRSSEIASELAQARSSLAELTQMRAQVQTRIDDENAAARAEREFEQALRARALRADGQGRLDLVSQAVSHERAAALHEKRAAEIELELATVTRVVEDRRREVETLERLERVQADTRSRLAASQSGWGDQRQSALDDARGSAQAVSEALALARATLDDRVSPAYDATVSTYQQAVSQARAAQGQLRQRAAAIAGSAQQAMAEMHMGMADALASLAETAASVEGAPNMTITGIDADGLRARAEEARAAAEDAMRSASSSFRSAGGALSEVAEIIDPDAAPAVEEASGDE